LILIPSVENNIYLTLFFVEETPVCIIYEKGEVGINIGKNVKMEIGYNKNINKICYNFSFKNIEILLLIIFIQNLYILT
jgi:hypothetical protein